MEPTSLAATLREFAARVERRDMTGADVMEQLGELLEVERRFEFDPSREFRGRRPAVFESVFEALAEPGVYAPGDRVKATAVLDHGGMRDIEVEVLAVQPVGVDGDAGELVVFLAPDGAELDRS